MKYSAGKARHALEILLYARPGLVCATLSKPLQLMTWRCKEPVHQQPWYCRNFWRFLQQQQKSSAVIQYKDVILVWTFQYRKSHCGDKTVLELSISTMGFPLLVRQHLYVESGPRNPEQNSREHQAVTWSYVDLLSVGSIDNTLAMLFLNENDMFKLIIIITELPKRKYGNSLYKQLYKCLNNKFLSCWQLVSSW